MWVATRQIHVLLLFINNGRMGHDFCFTNQWYAMGLLGKLFTATEERVCVPPRHPCTSDPVINWFTVPSVGSLLREMAKTLRMDLRKLDRNRWWWREDTAVQAQYGQATVDKIKSQNSGSVFLSADQSPGLRCSLRAAWHPHPPHHLRPEANLEVAFWLQPDCTPEGLAKFRESPTLEQQRRVFWTISKRV